MKLGFACSLALLLSAVECAAASLQCWKCIADNCDEPPEGNYKASKMTCPSDKSSCMKVEYSFNPNASGIIQTSIIRTCSPGPCIPITDSDFYRCVSKKDFAIRGCMKKSCCDAHLCNGGHNDVMSFLIILILLFASFVFQPGIRE